MLGLGVWEIVLILITALVVLGPDKLPQAARQLARLLGEVRRVSDEVRRNFDDVMAEPADTRRVDAPRPLPQGAHAADAVQAAAAPDAPMPIEPPRTAQHAVDKGAEAADVGAHHGGTAPVSTPTSAVKVVS